MSCDLGIIIEITVRLTVKAYLMKYDFFIKSSIIDYFIHTSYCK